MALTVRHRRHVARAGLLVGLVIGAVFAAGPVLWMLSSSFKSNANIFAYPPKLFDGSFSFAPYLAVLSNPTEIGYFVNSYIVALSVTVVTLLVAVLTGYVDVPTCAAATRDPKVDAVIAGDGCEWEGAEYLKDVVDSGRKFGALYAGFAATELPGTAVMARWLRSALPDLDVSLIPVSEAARLP